MEREAVKDVVDKLKESERYRQEWSLKSMLDFGQKTEVTGYGINITIAETETTENIARYGRLHSDQFLLNCSDDLRMNPTIFEEEGGEQTYSSGEYLTTDSGGEGLSVTNNMMTYEQSQASDFTKMILGQPLGHYYYYETTNMEPLTSVGRYGVIGGEQKVTVEETADPSSDSNDVL